MRLESQAGVDLDVDREVVQARDELVVSVVIPCLNEARTVGTCIAKAIAALEDLGLPWEVVVADNGSTDGSQALALAAGARVVDVPQRGYGSALAAGVASARGRYVVMGDADDSYDFSRLAQIVERLLAGQDLVVGNRFAGKIEQGAMPHLHRWLGNPLLSYVGRRLFRTPCGDLYCGLRGFDRKRIVSLDLRSHGMEYALEMVVKATVRGLRISEVPVTLSPDGRGRPPHLNTWRDGWRSLRLLVLYSPSGIFLYPGIALLAAGLLVGGALLPDARTLGAVTFDVSTLLYAALALIVGFQAVLFFVVSRRFAVAEGLLPDAGPLRWLTQGFTLERALVVGGALVLGGLAISVYAIGFWNQAAFGQLDYSRILRIVIPGSTLIVCGIQTMLAGLFVGLLDLRGRPSRRAGDRP